LDFLASSFPNSVLRTIYEHLHRRTYIHFSYSEKTLASSNDAYDDYDHHELKKKTATRVSSRNQSSIYFLIRKLQICVDHFLLLRFQLISHELGLRSSRDTKRRRSPNDYLPQSSDATITVLQSYLIRLNTANTQLDFSSIHHQSFCPTFRESGERHLAPIPQPRRLHREK
jgi:hypothetical protein